MMSRLYSAIANSFCCCRKPRNDDNMEAVSRFSHRASPEITVSQTVADTALTPNVRAPFQRRSSLSLYAKRSEMLKRYYSSSSSLETDSLSAPQRTEKEAMADRLDVDDGPSGRRQRTVWTRRRTVWTSTAKTGTPTTTTKKTSRKTLMRLFRTGRCVCRSVNCCEW